MFVTAGTKDKRAVTTQLVTAHKVPAEKLRNANDRLYGIKLGNFEYVKDPLKLGSLNGNHFTITLRNVEAPDSLIWEACESVKKFGFINYFGTQRFATGTVPTHHVGRLLLQSKWEEAITLILCPRSCEKEEAMNARKYYLDTQDAAGALRLMPRSHVVERLLLEAIKKYGKTLNAFSQIPVNMRLLYVHAYQSYLWNKMVSKRIDMAPSPDLLVPIVGDLVLEKSSGEYIYVTEQNIHKYTIIDVHLPLPGHSIKYPKHSIHDYLTQLMALDLLDPSDMKRNQRLFSLPGGYRPLLRKPLDFDFVIYHYQNLTDSLALTDVEIIEGKKEPPQDPNAPYTAIIIKMTLDSATYATMLIRELTKKSNESNIPKRITNEI